MKNLLNLSAILCLLIFSPQWVHAKRTASSQQNVKVKKIHYKSDTLKHIGFLAWDSKQKSKRPGILILPEWWGLNNDMQAKAKKLARKGYIVMVADLYGMGQKTKIPDVAGKLLQTIQGKNSKISRQSFMAAYLTLKQQKNVDSQNIALIGYGFGGSLATDMVYRGTDAKALINFFGPIKTDIKVKSGIVRPQILWIKGNDDTWITASMEKEFREQMNQAYVKFKVITYPETFHSFTYPEATQIGKKHRFFIKYSPEANKKSWAEVSHFLKGLLK